MGVPPPGHDAGVCRHHRRLYAPPVRPCAPLPLLEERRCVESILTQGSRGLLAQELGEFCSGVASCLLVPSLSVEQSADNVLREELSNGRIE